MIIISKKFDLSSIDRIEQGSLLIRYFYSGAYIRGIIHKTNSYSIEVDYDDTIYEYLPEDICLVENHLDGLHYITTNVGILKQKFSENAILYPELPYRTDQI